MKRLSILLFAVSAMSFSCNKKSQEVNIAKKDSVISKKPATPGLHKTMGRNTADNSGKPALNPPHGEPYHRCDIEVGAPLNSSAPVQNVAPPVVQQRAPIKTNNFDTNPIKPAQNNGPKPALNPPHGEPHHRCDLEVGAPLI